MLTDEPIGADAAGNDNNETETEDDIERNLLSPGDRIMPCDDAREGYGINLV
jgi:hypothetical protein